MPDKARVNLAGRDDVLRGTMRVAPAEKGYRQWHVVS